MTRSGATRNSVTLTVVIAILVGVAAAAHGVFAAPLLAVPDSVPSGTVNQPASAIHRAVRGQSSVVAPDATVPVLVRAHIEARTVRFNGCTANLIRDDSNDLLGIAGAAHCVAPHSNVMRDGSSLASGSSQPIERSAIMIDGATDVFYSGLDGHAASDVRSQLMTNYARSGIANYDQQPTPVIMTGYPSHNNPRGESVTLALTLGGTVRWPSDPVDTIATFGDWNYLSQSCTPGASGSGLYFHVAGRGYVVVAVLASHAEFRRVQTMPYSDEYGQELRIFFERQLDRAIDADFMCGFAPPTLIGG